MTGGSSKSVWVGLLVLAVVALVLPRLASPWRLENTNDEVHHHLKSWHHRYGTDNIYPDFLDRVQQMRGRLPGPAVDAVVRFYKSGGLAQRAVIVLVDPQPPLYPVAAEAIEAASGSSLVALRLLSVAAGLAGVGLLFWLGRLLADDRLGLVLATFGAAGGALLMFVGIGRPYALVHAALAGVLVAYAGYVKGRWPVGRFLAAAVLCQATQWMAWAVVGPLVIAAIVRELRRGTPVGRLLLRTAWYGLLSVALLAYLAVQLKNPTITNQSERAPLAVVLNDYLRTTFVPFTALMPTPAVVAGALGVIALAGAGVATGLRRFGPWVAWPLAGSMLAGLLAITLVGTSLRFALTYTLPAAVLAGFAVYALPRGITAAAVAVVLVLNSAETVYAWDRLGTPAYAWIDPPYTPVAAAVRTHLRPGEPWCALPYFYVNPLYRYGPFPEPKVTKTSQQVADAAAGSATGSVLVLASKADVALVDAAGRNETVADFPYLLTLRRVYAGPPPARPATTASSTRPAVE